MDATLGVPQGLREKVSAFVEAEGLAIQVVSDGGGTMRVAESSERLPCSPTILQAGGWITCPTARAMAGRLGAGGRQMGKLLDLLNIKVRECELGCFE